LALLAAAGALALTGCDGMQSYVGATAPAPRPPLASLRPPQPSPESRAQAVYFSKVQADLLTQGLLRRDGGGPDVPFSARNLADNFIKVALYDEYTDQGGRLIARETPSHLRRWEQPIRMALEFGPTIAPSQRTKDRANIAHYTRRLSRLTGLPIRLNAANPNFHVLILNEDERRAVGPYLRKLVPGIEERAVRTITDMPRATLCLVFAFSDDNSPGAYTQAVAVIRGEHPDLLRLSCIHEELAQSLGLANDSPAARPSIFNDDEEFGLLTSQDELMLKMLYDKRLKLGMTPREARPIVEKIAAELMGGAA